MSIKFTNLLLPLFLLSVLYSAAQAPANDNCANASPVVISNNGYGVGTFTSAQADLTSATVETGETFYSTISSAGENKKSVWYSFYLPTARYCTLTLEQPSSLIASNDVGFTVYKTNSCFPNTAEADSALLAAQSVFGHSTNPCLKPGNYLVQVSSNNAADGPIFITLLLDNPSPALYDQTDSDLAYNFGVPPSCQNYVDFTTGCQTVEDSTESCPNLGANYLDWTQSVWLTFTTPAYIDWAQILIGPTAGCCFNNNPGATFAYNLYKGDVITTPISSLTLIDGCVVDTFVNYGPWFQREYECELDTSTRYSVQIFFNKTFADNVRVYLDILGVSPSGGPQPTTAAVVPANILGVLPGGNGSTYDYWGCNSRLSQNACGQTNPVGGVYYAGTKYTLNDWFTFQITQPSNIYFNIYNNGNAPFVRIFKKDIAASCSNIDTLTDLYTQFVSSTSLTCVQPGTYSMQVLGRDDDPQWGCAWRDELGQRLNVTYTVTPTQAFNHYSLDVPGAVDTVNDVANAYAPLQQNVSYNTGVDTFGCDNTVMPAGTHCNDPDETKAIYYQFLVGDANGDGVPDSGYVTFQGSFSWNYWQAGNILYQGDANSLSTAQVAHLSGDTINGLSKASLCFGNGGCAGPRACVTPGIYTLVTFGDSTIVGQNATWSMTEQLVTTVYHSAALAENMGSIIDSIALYGGSSITSATDHFSCLDNPDSIGGLGPCPLAYGNPATKLIYRQFYLSAPALVTITSSAAYTCAQAGTLTLFYGEATNGIGTLTPVGGPWTCFNNTYTGPCTPLAAGWYTIIAYGEGPTYGSPAVNYNGNRGAGGDVGFPNYVNISITQAPPGPVYDHPYKAAIDTTTNLPFLIKPTANRSSNDYPVTDTIYNLYTENYNCTTDTPWALQSVMPCTNSYQPNRVTYYVFTVPNMSYIHIYGMNGAMCEVFPFDVRTDSAQMLTTPPVQPCNSNGDYTQLCRLVAGTYTLVIFPPDNFAGSGIRPSIYIDSVGYSRFDNAVSAYDFGAIPMDSNWYSGAVGSVNPIDANRAASDDFFYCTTGAQANDPTANACYVTYDPLLYNSVNNDYAFDAAAPGNGYNVPRRNLWYTFTLDNGGTCYIKVNNMTADKTSQYPFAVYLDTVNGNTPFNTLVGNGQVDSTIAMGLTSVASNYYYYCGYYNQISFYRAPCTAIKQRYYLVVDNPNNMEPNSQVEVNILYDTIHTTEPLYDHYYEANVINGLNQTAPPYTNVAIDTGTFMGGVDNFTCASQDSTDPNPCNCAQKNLWYKFTVNESGLVRLRYLINGQNQTTVDGCQLTWYRQAISGDSTTNGLKNLPGVTYNYYDYPTGTYWYQTCITAGTYYILMTGCNRTDETVQPVVWMIDQHGDYCDDPIAGSISAPGAIDMTAVVDCHTIGGDFGEDGSNMGCLIPNGDSIPQFKSTWYRFTITGSDTFDITPVLTDNTNVLSDQIRYRMLYGTCTAMNPGSCFVSASTVNTFNCMTQGSYYIQVVEPTNQFGYPFGQVTGTISVQINAALSTPGCIPVSNCFVVANWISNQSCANDSVYFVNQSTEGDSILYHWDFGEGDTANIKNPVFAFPTPQLTQNYSVLLTVTNTACNKQDSLRQTITANQKPTVVLPADTTLCPPLSLVLHATTWPGATYLWQDGTTDSVYNVTTGGTYTVTDSFNNCKVSKSITVGTGTQPAVNLGPDQALCAGMNYQANLTQSPGETFLWNTGSTSPNFTTDSAGTYSVTATQGTCIARDAINVSNLSNSKPFGSDTNLCTGTTLTLNATTFGASGYLWNDGSTNPVKVIQTPGLYAVKITVSNCFVIDSINVISVTSPAPKITGDSALCAPGDSATIDAGVGYATYRWSTGDSTQTITVTMPATYRVTVSNAAGCTGVDSFIVRQSSPMALVTANTNVSCNGGNNGAIQLTVNGGTAAYAYTWSQSSTTANISNLIAGNYAVTVKDVIGCTATINDTITQPTALTDSVIVTPVICFGQANGTALITVTGGTGQDVFVWSNSVITASNNGLTTGTYTVTVTDSLLCTVTASAVIIQPTILKLALTDTNVTCAGFNNGKIDTTEVQGGTMPYTYLWTGGATTANISNLSPGAYTVTVTDLNGCTVAESATITAPQPLQLSVTTVDVLCNGNNTGSITTLLSGGTGVDTYLWSNSATTPAITQLVAGSYTITVTDANNCTTDTTIAITQPTALAITVDSFTAPSCYGYSDGSIYTTESGGVTPYTLSWSNSATTASITNVTNGTYTLTVTDSNQCSLSKAVILTPPDTLIIKPTITDVSCFGENDGSIKTVVTGGTSPYTYLWSNAATLPQITALPPGDYAVTVTDAHNCVGADTGLVITQPAVLEDSLGVINETCPVAKNGSVISNVTGGTGPYTYTWSNNSNTANITNIHAGIYLVTVDDHNGCSATATATVIIQPTLILEATVDNPLCPPLQNGSIALVVGGNTDPYEYQWTGQQQGASPTGLSPGNYAVTVTDKYGCTIDSAFTLQYQFVLTLQATPSFTVIKLGQLVQLATTTNGTQLHYEWTPIEGLTCADCSAPIASPTVDTRYMVTGQDNNGCTAFDTLNIQVSPDYDIFIPNAFTPNNDGNNDFFEIFGNKAAMRYVAVEVFDRWGEKVFESNSPDFEWDGTFKGKLLQPGVFVYAIQVSFSDGHSDKLFKGSVTLIR